MRARPVKENYLISGYFVFFLIAASQIGVSSFYFQTLVAKEAGQDAWISILSMGLSLHIIVWMIYKMLGHPAKDLIDLHRILFGRILGNVISLLMVGYFFMRALDILQTYMGIIQVWVFPSLKTWEMALLLISMFYYIISGGFRALSGFCFFCRSDFHVIYVWFLFPHSVFSTR
ncbi:hypothetical protein EHS13_12345 [Paenibacillus psychroresistens]|uniref:Spore germination protein n=1 Tax=Paenibacillus psychroresistens TaxID=1778678 RepID=A0A6B8RY85_9BACL|nr:hypothetical protein EHS13_12345 [Paenibacillus psychroresistens]